MKLGNSFDGLSGPGSREAGAAGAGKYVPTRRSLSISSICRGRATVAQLDWGSTSEGNDIPYWPDICEYLVVLDTGDECRALKELDFNALVAARCTLVIVSRAYDRYVVTKSLGANVSTSHQTQGVVQSSGKVRTEIVGAGIPVPNTDARYELVINNLRKATPGALWKYWWYLWDKYREKLEKNKTATKPPPIRSPQTWEEFLWIRAFNTATDQIRKEPFVRTFMTKGAYQVVTPKTSQGSKAKTKPKPPLYVHMDLSGERDLHRNRLKAVWLLQMALELRARDETIPGHKTHQAERRRHAQLFRLTVIEGYSRSGDKDKLAEDLKISPGQVTQDWETTLKALKSLRLSKDNKYIKIFDEIEDLMREEPLLNRSISDRLRDIFGGDFDEK